MELAYRRSALAEIKKGQSYMKAWLHAIIVYMENLAIRLDDDRYRRLRVFVAQQGLTLQKAVEAALDHYIAEASLCRAEGPPRDYRGFLRGTDVMELMEQERRT